MSPSSLTTFRLEYEISSHFDAHFLLLRNQGVTTPTHIYRSNSSIIRLFVFFLQQRLVESTFHQSCKSIICYQYLSLTFLTCSNICFYFFSGIERWHTHIHSALDFKRRKMKLFFSAFASKTKWHEVTYREEMRKRDSFVNLKNLDNIRTF